MDAEPISVEIGDPDKDGWRWILVNKTRVKRVRNKETIQKWMNKFKESTHPMQMASTIIEAKRKKDKWLSYRGVLISEIRKEFPEMVWVRSRTDSYYGFFGKKKIIRISNHNPHPGDISRIQIHETGIPVQEILVRIKELA